MKPQQGQKSPVGENEFIFLNLYIIEMFRGKICSFPGTQFPGFMEEKIEKLAVKATGFMGKCGN